MVSLNWSRNSQAFYINDELVKLNTSNNKVSPVHDFLHCVLHILGALDLKESFDSKNEIKVIAVEDCIRLTLDNDLDNPKDIKRGKEKRRKVDLEVGAEVIAANLIYLASPNYYDVTDELTKILSEVSSSLLNCNSLDFYISAVKDLLENESNLKQTGFHCVIDSSDSDRLGANLGKSNIVYSKLVNRLILYVTKLVNSYLSRNKSSIPIIALNYA